MDPIDSVLFDDTSWSRFLSLFRWMKSRVELPRRDPHAEYLYTPPENFPPKYDWSGLIDWIYGLHFGVGEFVFFAVFFYIGILFYRKIRYPFWNNQPVLHTYDIFSRLFWLNSPHIICKTPVKLKHYNRTSSTQEIKTEPADTMSRETAIQLCQFLRENWIPSDRVLSTLIEKNLFAIFVGHEHKSFYSILCDATTTQLPGKVEGVIISHPMTIYMRHDKEDRHPPQKIATTHIDYMAVRRNEKQEEDTIHSLFQTHEYNSRIGESAIATTLFKKEVDPCDSLVSLFEYTSSLYYLRLFMKLPRLPAHYQIVEINHRINTDLLHSLFERNYLITTFELVVLNSLPNILALLKNRQMRIFCLKRKEDVFAFYFFRDPYLFYEDLNGKQVDLVGSFINTQDTELAYHGFLHSMRELLREKKPDDLYNVLQIHGFGHNKILEEKWRHHHTKILETKINYYLYNHTYSTTDNTRVFFL